MVIKMSTIDGAHAANAINYVLDKEKARMEDNTVFLASNKTTVSTIGFGERLSSEYASLKIY